MLSTVLLPCLVAVATALPTSIKMFEIQPAPMKLRFDPYDVTWEKFKQEHSECSTHIFVVVYATLFA
jgi:hypothetical protein